MDGKEAIKRIESITRRWEYDLGGKRNEANMQSATVSLSGPDFDALTFVLKTLKFVDMAEETPQETVVVSRKFIKGIHTLLKVIAENKILVGQDGRYYPINSVLAKIEGLLK